jgi:hypothetical protein
VGFSIGLDLVMGFGGFLGLGEICLFMGIVWVGVFGFLELCWILELIIIIIVD